MDTILNILPKVGLMYSIINLLMRKGLELAEFAARETKKTHVSSSMENLVELTNIFERHPVFKHSAATNCF